MPPLDLTLASRAPVLDERPLSKRVGLIILATDHTTEVDFQRMVAGDRIGVYATRIPYANPVTPENLRAMQPSLTMGAALILPDAPLDVVMYSCTSASVVIGDANIEAAVKTAKPTAAVLTPTAAAVSGLRALGAKRISVLTPYTVETSVPMADYFRSLGFDIARFTCLGLTDDREMARISPAEIEAANIIAARFKEYEAKANAAELIHPAFHGNNHPVNVNFGTVEGGEWNSSVPTRARIGMRVGLMIGNPARKVAAEIEAATGKPVVTSNLATAWATLRLCGDETARPALGRLMTLAYPGAAP